MIGIPFEEALHLIRERSVPLIIIPRDPSTDALAAGLGLLLGLERAGKTAHLVSPDFQLPPHQGFLPKSEAVRASLASLRSFIISVNTKQAPLDSLSYDLVGDQLRIYLTPKNGYFEPKDVTTSPGAFAYDLVLVLGIPDLNTLGDLYTTNAEFFAQTPIIALDTQPANTRYGHVNLVDIVASSLSEVVFELLQRLTPDGLDEHIATNLLSGIISNTKGFQSQAVTPRSLAAASHLITAGARREEIVRNLFQTKTVTTLQLWGRALANLKTSSNGRVAWSILRRTDMEHTKAVAADALGVLDELMVNMPNTTIAALFIENDGQVDVHIVTTPGTTPTLPDGINPQTPAYAMGTVRGAIAEVSARVIETLQKQAR